MINNTKVVIADDMEPILLYIEKLLSEINEIQLVGKAKNGKELVEIVCMKKPDLVITDVEMPKYTGIQAIEELNKLGVNSKYILITSNGNAIITSKANEMGILTVIKKPILDDKKFIEQIRKHITNENIDKGCEEKIEASKLTDKQIKKKL